MTKHKDSAPAPHKPHEADHPQYFAAEEFQQCMKRLRALPLDATVEPDLVFAPATEARDGSP